MTRRTPTEQTDAWRSRPWLSFFMRTLIYGIPLLSGLAVSSSIGRVLPGGWDSWVSLGIRAVAAVAASMIVASATTRLMPLALLLKMNMIFPDVAPSRLAVARRTTSVKELTRRLEHGEPSEREAATTMLALVAALDRHDRKTRGHSERVRLFCDLLGDELGLDQAARGRLRWAALVHDIGKLHVNQRILNKPSTLSANEWATIKAHPEAGSRLAQPLASWLGPWFAGIAEHHEQYDGSGYPRGLVGEEISLSGRAISVVDAFETMTAARAYKSPMSTWAARAELARCAGTHFDPIVVRAFLRIALPRVLRVVGPLAFLINAPLLKVLGQAPVRVLDAASLGTSHAISAASVTAVAVAVSTAPVGAGEAPTGHVTVVATQAPMPLHQKGQRPVPVAAPSPPRRRVETNRVSTSPPVHRPSGAVGSPLPTRVAAPVPADPAPTAPSVVATAPTTPAAAANPDTPQSGKSQGQQSQQTAGPGKPSDKDTKDQSRAADQAAKYAARAAEQAAKDAARAADRAAKDAAKDAARAADNAARDAARAAEDAAKNAAKAAKGTTSPAPVRTAPPPATTSAAPPPVPTPAASAPSPTATGPTFGQLIGQTVNEPATRPLGSSSQNSQNGQNAQNGSGSKNGQNGKP